MGEERGRTGRRTSLFRGGCCGINSVESRRGGEGAERERDREERRIGENRCVCVRVRVTGYERERERGRVGCTGTGLVRVGERKTARQRVTPLPPSLSTLLSLHPPPPLPPPDNPRSRCIQGRCYRQRTIHALPLPLSLSLPLCNSFPLPSSSSCRLEPLAPDLPSHAHASIINACVRGAGGVPRRV